MLTCREVAHTIASDELERASWRRRLDVFVHLAMCVDCRSYARRIRLIGEGARALFADTGEDAERISRLSDAILEHCRPDE